MGNRERKRKETSNVCRCCHGIYNGLPIGFPIINYNSFLCANAFLLPADFYDSRAVTI